MWPFKKQKTKVEHPVDRLPEAIEIAAQKWVRFIAQDFTSETTLGDILYLFSEGLGRGLKQWEVFKNSPDSLMLLIAAKGAEKSRTHLRIQIETILGFPLPTPHERTDEEEIRY